jgi:eukaryotic-like serine/threonine-protein kinase
MNLATDFRFVMLALRDRLADPVLLAEAGLSWSPADGPLLDHLVARGVISPDDIRRLGRSAGKPPESAARTVTARPTSASPPNPAATSTFAPTDAEAEGITPASDTRHTGDSLSAVPLGGRYEPIRLHRTGGLGQVWLARDAIVGREVALKTLRPDRTATSETAARFVREARMTGVLEHPGIVPLYDLAEGSLGSGPWYVMRFVAGRTLAEAGAEYHQRRRAGTARPLDLAGLLDAFVAVCRAVAFAHSRDVLHRDLKGQNVVLGAFGEVFLLDWGLAKLAAGAVADGTDAAAGEVGLTTPGTIAGTPAYMAPEVAAGRPATKASEVYGLGAVLYELLTGKPPAEGRTPQDIVRQVVAAAPPAPRVVDSAVPCALEAVCLRALARDPAARYPSADELATDVRRWLADEPVSAYREPLAVRAARWARRRRTAVAAAAVFLVTVSAALAVTTALVWREQQATARERDRAAENFLTARSLALDLGGRIAALETGRTAPRPVDQARQAALEAAIKAFERFQADQPDDTALRRQAGLLHRFAANVARSLNDTRAAEASYRASIRAWEELADQHPREVEYRSLLAETLWDYAALQRRTGRLRDAAETLGRAVAVAEALPEFDASDSTVNRTVGVALLERAEVEYLRGQFADAQATAGRAAGLFDHLRDAPVGQANPIDPLLAVMAVNRMALAQREAGRPAEARKTHDDAVNRLNPLAGPQAARDIAFWSARVRLERARTAALTADGRAAAGDDFAAAARALEGLTTDYAHTPLYREWLAAAYLGRGELHAAQAQPGPGGADLNKARELLENLIRFYPDIPDYRGLLGRTCTALGRLAAAAGDAPGAADWFRKAKVVLDGASKRDPDNVFHRRAADELGRERPR